MVRGKKLLGLDSGDFAFSPRLVQTVVGLVDLFNLSGQSFGAPQPRTVMIFVPNNLHRFFARECGVSVLVKNNIY